MTTIKWLGVVVLASLLSFWGGCRTQAAHDDRVQREAQHVADSLLRVLAGQHQAIVDSLKAEDAKAHAEAVLAQAESDRLRGLAAGFALGNRRRDTALARARTAGDSLPLVLADLGDMRMAYDTLKVADSVSRVNAAKELASRLDLAEKRRLADSTKAAAVETALREDLKGVALRLDRALNARKLFGLVEVTCVAPGYGIVVPVQQPLKLYHGVSASCGVKLGFRL